jgi:hypothetical protein
MAEQLQVHLPRGLANVPVMSSNMLTVSTKKGLRKSSKNKNIDYAFSTFTRNTLSLKFC